MRSEKGPLFCYELAWICKKIQKVFLKSMVSFSIPDFALLVHFVKIPLEIFGHCLTNLFSLRIKTTCLLDYFTLTSALCLM